MTWWLLHTFTGYYPENPTEERRKSFVTFMESLAENFPCSICGVHLKEYLTKKPIYPATKDRESLQLYMYELHEDVNRRKKKPQMHTFEEVKQAFDPKKPWETFGGYPILPRKTFYPAKGNSGKNLAKQGNESSGMERTYLWVIIALVLIIFVIGAVAIYFFVQSKSAKVK